MNDPIQCTDHDLSASKITWRDGPLGSIDSLDRIQNTVWKSLHRRWMVNVDVLSSRLLSRISIRIQHAPDKPTNWLPWIKTLGLTPWSLTLGHRIVITARISDRESKLFEASKESCNVLKDSCQENIYAYYVRECFFILHLTPHDLISTKNLYLWYLFFLL